MIKKTNRIICLVFAIIFIFQFTISPIIETEKAYAFTYDSVLDSELMKHTLIQTLIAGGLVFTSKTAIDETVYELKDWLYDQGFNFEMPEDPQEPQGPKIKLGDVILGLAGGQVLYDAAREEYRLLTELPNAFFNLIKSWVDLKFNPGENYELLYNGIPFSVNDIVNYYTPIDCSTYIRFKQSNGNYTIQEFPNITTKTESKIYRNGSDLFIHVGNGVSFVSISSNIDFSYVVSTKGNSNPFYINQNLDILGQENIVNNPNYDWNNPYTNSKTITVPVQPEVDSDGLHKPSVGTEWWVNKEPHEITTQEPTGIPQPEIPEIPDIENPNEDTSILITIGVLLQNLLRQITGIRNDTATIKENTNELTEGSGSGGNDGTDIPTGFDWGDFKRFFDVIYIFIYFIIILILLLVKLLNLVFLGLVNVPSNTDLFSQYPNILSGVNYIKNLKVGGLTVTVHQAFEYVFTIFFFIFIIKQIRKLYDSYVYEENERIKTAQKQSTNFKKNY